MSKWLIDLHSLQSLKIFARAIITKSITHIAPHQS